MVDIYILDILFLFFTGRNYVIYIIVHGIIHCYIKNVITIKASLHYSHAWKALNLTHDLFSSDIDIYVQIFKENT